MAHYNENKDNYAGGPVERTGRGHVTNPSEYKKGSLPETNKYVLDKNPKVNPRVSSPADAKEEPEPGKSS